MAVRWGLLALLFLAPPARLVRAQPSAGAAPVAGQSEGGAAPGPGEGSSAPAADTTPTTRARPALPMELDGCASEAREVRRLVALELDADVGGQGEGAAPEPTASRPAGLRVKVVCRDAQYRVYVVDADPEQTRTRGLDLRAMGPAVRPRFIALAIVEALTTRPVDSPPIVRITREEEEEEVRDDDRPAPRAEPPEPERVTLLSTRGLGRYFPTMEQASWGAGLLLSHRLTERLEGELDLAGEGASQGVSLGTITTRAISIGVGAAMLRQLGDLTFRAAAGARLGLVQIAGTPDAADTRARAFAGPWAGPTLSGGVRVRLPRSLALDVAVEVGHAVIQSTGRARTPEPTGGARIERAGVSGPWIALLASVGWAP